MKNYCLLGLSALMIAILTAVSCTATPQPVTTKPAVQETVQKPEIQPPAIKDILGPKAAALSEDTLFTCWAIDPDGRKLTYDWSVEAGTVRGTGREAIWTTPDKPGNYTISVRVTNDAGMEASLSKSFNMVETPETHKFTDTTIYLKMQLPGYDVVKVQARSKVMTTNEIQCSVEGQDAEQLTFKWNCPIGKLSGIELGKDKASRVGWISPGTPGDYSLSVIVSNQSGQEARGKINFEVYAE